MARFVIRDAVHGDVYLTREEGRLLDTIEMQRLRGIRQLGLTHLVYPGARHSRFEHSIGTLHMVQRLIDAVNRNADQDAGRLHRVDAGEARVMRAAALVHDVTHVPFGHNIEDQCGLLERHDRPQRYLGLMTGSELGAELQAQGLLEPVLGVLGAGTETGPPFLAQMISDTICSDLMDYLERDALFTGLHVHFDPRVADYFKIEAAGGRLFVDCEKHGLLREDIVSEILQMLQARYYFSERVYYHHAKIAAGAMVARVVETALTRQWLTPAELYRSTDESLLWTLAARLQAQADADARVAVSMLERLQQRRLLKRVAVFPYADNVAVQADLIDRFFAPAQATARRGFERQLEAEAAAAFGRDIQVVFYCPNRRMQLKEVDTLVRFPGQDDLRPLSHFKRQLPRIADLEESYLRLWRAYVLTDAVEHEVRGFLQQRVRALLPQAVDAYRIH